MEKYIYTKSETYKHINNVAKNITQIIKDLLDRSLNHDNSKLSEYELEGFSIHTEKLNNLEYGSNEYNNLLKSLNEILDHHYKNNDHHPEHFENGIQDMNLIQLVEMLCDWKAAGLRHKNGDIYKSIDYNQKRFGYSDELKNIMINTCKYLNW